MLKENKLKCVSQGPIVSESSIIFKWALQLRLHLLWFALVIGGTQFAIRNWLFVICGHMRGWVMWSVPRAMIIWLHTHTTEVGRRSSKSYRHFALQKICKIKHFISRVEHSCLILSRRRCWAFPDQQMTIRHWQSRRAQLSINIYLGSSGFFSQEFPSFPKLNDCNQCDFSTPWADKLRNHVKAEHSGRCQGGAQLSVNY